MAIPIRILICLLLFASGSYAAEFKPGFAAELLTDQLNSPTSIAVAPDGRVFVSEKNGQIRVIENGQLLSDPALVIAVDEYGERGLGCILLDQEFDQNGYFYVYYNVPNAEHNRISRFTLTGNFANPGSEYFLMDLAPLASTIHNGGTMRWGPDGMLYVATGEGAKMPLAQSLTSELGKMLRLNKDGSIPGDNPYFNETSGNARAIYAMGVRNPFTFDIDPLSGRIFLNDVGLSSWEEVNEIFPRKNYGWPIIEGYWSGQTPPADYLDPIYAYPHSEGCAVVGGLVYNYPDSDYPDEIQNHYLFGDFCTGILSMLNLQTNQVEDTFATRMSNMTNLAVDPSTGELLFCEFYRGTLWRVKYIGTGAPFISEDPKPVFASIGENASFSVSAVSIDTIGYDWYRDGIFVPWGDSAKVEFGNLSVADSGATIYCRVYNASGTTNSDTVLLHVTANQRPQIVFSLPDTSVLFQAGDTIWFGGHGIDPEEGTLADHHLSWKVDFHHGEHTHPVIGQAVVTDSGNFVVPRIGETDPGVWYRISVTATDSKGQTGTGSREIFPAVGQVSLQTIPSGLELTLDGSGLVTPYQFDGVVGTYRTLAAPEYQIRNDSIFRFVNWEQATGNDFNIEIDLQPMGFAAVYDFMDHYYEGSGDGLKGEYFNNIEVAGDPLHVQVDPEINFRYEWDKPSNIMDIQIVEQLGRDSFSIRWTGDLLAPVSGTYEFHLQYNDRVRFYLADELLLNHFAEFAGTDSIQVVLQGGLRYPIQVDYAELGFASKMIFSWTTPYFERVVVPQTQLYSDNFIVPPPGPAFDSSFVFPVPLGDVLHLYIHDVKEQDRVKVSIFNAMGMLVKEARVEASPLQPGRLDISDLPGGQLYFIRLFNGGRVTRLRAVKY
jgi:glucose/arabinose dehydrogenase